MDVLTVFAIAVALGTDAFSLSLGMGLTGLRRKWLMLFPGIVAAFHVVMPLVGMYAGKIFGVVLGQVAGIIGGAILLIIGGRTLYGVLQGEKGESFTFKSARSAFATRSRRLLAESFSGLLVLALGVSLDALSVGFSLGTLGAQVWGAVVIIGIVAGLMTATGQYLGRYLGGWIGQRAETLGGLILVAIGIKIIM